MNPDTLIRNQQLDKLRGAAANGDAIPAGLSRRIDPTDLHFSETEEEQVDEIPNELEEDYEEEPEEPNEEDS